MQEERQEAVMDYLAEIRMLLDNPPPIDDLLALMADSRLEQDLTAIVLEMLQHDPG